MIQLVIVYCLAADAKECVERRAPIESALPMACMVEGEKQAQDYVRWHPKWKLSRWRCEVDVPRQLPA